MFYKDYLHLPRWSCGGGSEGTRRGLLFIRWKEEVSFGPTAAAGDIVGPWFDDNFFLMECFYCIERTVKMSVSNKALDVIFILWG